MKIIIKKKGRRLLAMALVMVLTLGTIHVSSINDVEAASEPQLNETVLLQDDFSSGSWIEEQASPVGWWRLGASNQLAGALDTEKKTAPLGYTTSNRNLYESNNNDGQLEDVHIQADIYVSTSYGGSSTQPQLHFLNARSNNQAQNGIVFGFATVRGANKSSLIVGTYAGGDSVTAFNGGETEAVYSIGKTYRLDLYVVGNLVIAKCDGTTIYCEEVSGINTSGYCGIVDRRATSNSNGTVYGTDYTKGGYFDNVSIGTVEEVKADGFTINGPVIAKADGTGIADITLYAGGVATSTMEDVTVTVSGLENQPANLYEGKYTVTTTIGGAEKTAVATRVFVVDDLSKTVTNMGDSRWTGATASANPKFTVDAEGVATLTPSSQAAAGISVLNVGENNGAYGNFYTEYTMTVSNLAEEQRGFFDSILCIDSYGATEGNAWQGNLFYDQRASQAPKKTFWGRLKGATTINFGDTVAETDIGVGIPITVGMLVYDKTVTLLINGAEVATYTGAVDFSGWFGIAQSSTVGVAKIENFVYIPLAKKVISVEFNAPEVVMQGATVEVKATPTYTWPYGVGEQTTVGVVLDGLDTSTDGEKTYTASFEGIQEQLTITVTKKPDGFRVNGPIVMTKEGTGVADATILAGESVFEEKEDVQVIVAGLDNPDIGLYEGNYQVTTDIYGTDRTAAATRVFVVEKLEDAVTNMSDDRWTGKTATDEPNFTVDALTGKATLHNNQKYSVLSMGENDSAYNNFYVEYTLHISGLENTVKNWYSTRFIVAERAPAAITNATSFSGDVLHDGSGKYNARLYQRTENKQLGATSKVSSNTDVTIGDTMTIGMLVYDEGIQYFVDGVNVATYTYADGQEPLIGWFSLFNEKASNGNPVITVDDFIYVPIGEKVIQDITFSYPKAVTPGASVDVSVVPVYNWPYGEGEAVSEGVVVTGLDTATLGEKTFQASYGGVEKTLQLVVSNVLFEEDFDGTLDDLIDNGWGNVSKTTASLTEDKLYLLGNQEGLYATDVAGSDAWSDYTVKAEVMITMNGNSANTNVASLVARSTGLSDGYEWSLCVNQDGTSYVRLYDRAAKEQLLKVDYPVDINEVYTMRLTVVGDTMKGYINDEKIIETTATTCSAGTIGVRRNGYGVYYDNVVVSLPEDDAPAEDVTKQKVWFTDTFEAETTMAERGWDMDGIIQNGELILNNKNETAFISQISGSADWTDYTAQAKVTVVDSDEISSVNHSVSALIVRSTSAKTGYEFGVLVKASDNKGGFRLYNRTTGETLASTEDVVAERGKTYQLKTVVEGNRILCYVDGKLVFDVTDEQNSNPTGYVGLRTVGYSGAYDDIVVRKIIDSDRTEQSPNSNASSTISPVTGDITMSIYLPMIAMMITMGVIVFIYRRRNKKVIN